MSDSHKVEISFKCNSCGGTVLELPENPADDSVVRCKSCQIIVARWGDIKAKAADWAGANAGFKRAFERTKPS